MARLPKAQRRRARRNNPVALRAAKTALLLAPLVPKFDDLTMDTERRILAATAGKTRYGERILAAHDRLTPYRKAAGRAIAATAQRIRDFEPLVSEARQIRAALKNPGVRRAAMLLSDAFGPLPDWADDIRGRVSSAVSGAIKAPKKRPPARRNPPPVVGMSCYVKGKPAVVVAYPAPGTKGRVQVRFHRTGALMSVTPASIKTAPKGKK